MQGGTYSSLLPDQIITKCRKNSLTADHFSIFIGYGTRNIVELQKSITDMPVLFPVTDLNHFKTTTHFKTLPGNLLSMLLK